MAQMVKCLPAMWETWVQSLCQEDPLEKEMTTHSSTLAWKIPWTEEPCKLQSMGSQKLDMTEQLHFKVMKRFYEEPVEELGFLGCQPHAELRPNKKFREW